MIVNLPDFDRLDLADFKFYTRGDVDRVIKYYELGLELAMLAARDKALGLNAYNCFINWYPGLDKVEELEEMDEKNDTNETINLS